MSPKPKPADDKPPKGSKRPTGHDSTMPAGKGGKGAPHGRPGDGPKGGSKDPKAPHGPPGG